MNRSFGKSILISYGLLFSISLVSTIKYEEEEQPLPRDVTPYGYNLEIEPFISSGFYNGRVRINLTCQKSTDQITLHAAENLYIKTIVLKTIAHNNTTDHYVNVSRIELPSNKPHIVLYLDTIVNRGFRGELDIVFSAKLRNYDQLGGLHKNKWFAHENNTIKYTVASYFYPNLARTAFPCFDEPSFKTPFVVSIARQTHMIALSNMPLDKSEPNKDRPNWVWDRFQSTPPMPVFALGLLVSDGLLCTSLNTTNGHYKLRVWSRSDIFNESTLRNLTEQIHKSVENFEKFWAYPYPLSKLDIIVIPEYNSSSHDGAKGWGFMVLQEPYVKQIGVNYYYISYKLAYQWLGCLATPYRWIEMSYSFNGYVSHYINVKAHNEKEKPYKDTYWRLPYYCDWRSSDESYQVALSRYKILLVLQILRYTLSESTFKHALQEFMANKRYDTFSFDHDIWNAFTRQARTDRILHGNMTITEVAASWMNSECPIPTLDINRDYVNNLATITQNPYTITNEKQHFWWIPIVYIRQDKMNFPILTHVTWMKGEREIILRDLPASDSFILVNPEALGLFSVNYDIKNWNMLANYLCTEDRIKIPVDTRAKLLFDAKNLAERRVLSYGIALNMTKFLRNEHESQPFQVAFHFLSTILGHITRNADVYPKFQISIFPHSYLQYIRHLFAPAYERTRNGTGSQTNLPQGLQNFMCFIAGWSPCIEEARKDFKKCVQANQSNKNCTFTDYDNNVCMVLKWGTNGDWEYAIEQLNRFSSNKTAERNHLLRLLIRCPTDPEKIEKFLNLTILEQTDRHFTDRDVYFALFDIPSSADGYLRFFKFLRKNWDFIKQRFNEQPQIWNLIIERATNYFQTQEGLDLVLELYRQRKSGFGTAYQVIEDSLKSIREEIKWNNRNLPAIKEWLDENIFI